MDSAKTVNNRMLMQRTLCSLQQANSSKTQQARSVKIQRPLDHHNTESYVSSSSSPLQNMNDRPEDRPRPRSFRIDDILASTETKAPSSTTPTISSSSDGASSSVTSSSLRSPCVVPLNFGVDSLLSRNSTDLSTNRYGKPYYQLKKN